ncbi:MAG TPA: VWA domain-containing protein [Thermoanaerobaculia bacterium]|nr:VWA domain-containing protein [Thermoanaerobaculia bacterium]
MKRSCILALGLIALVLPRAWGSDPPVRFAMNAPSTLVVGEFRLPVLCDERVTRIELRVNGTPFAFAEGRSAVFTVPVGHYLRRLRFRAIGYGLAGQVVGEDEMVVNDPQPPLRVRLLAPSSLPEREEVVFTAVVTAPLDAQITAVEFFLGEQKIGTDRQSPWSIRFDPAHFEASPYARAVMKTASGAEANDVHFFGASRGEALEVVLQQIPLSVAGNMPGRPLTAADVTLLDDGEERKIESLVPSSDQPLHLIMLIDSSESMLEELPIVQKAGKEFARSVLARNGQIAVVGFHQRLFWLTGFTSNLEAIDHAIDSIEPRGQTHLYESVIRMLFELQKKPGRRALVVLSDGVNQGGEFTLDHLIHYARYSGVPVYPIIRNTLLSRMMRFGLRWFEANRFASIAEETGATWFIVRDPGELAGVYSQIARELREQYLLSFYAESPEADRWHTLAIRTSIPGLRLRIPRGYFP